MGREDTKIYLKKKRTNIQIIGKYIKTLYSETLSRFFSFFFCRVAEFEQEKQFRRSFALNYRPVLKAMLYEQNEKQKGSI